MEETLVVRAFAWPSGRMLEVLKNTTPFWTFLDGTNDAHEMAVLEEFCGGSPSMRDMRQRLSCAKQLSGMDVFQALAARRVLGL